MKKIIILVAAIVSLVGSGVTVAMVNNDRAEVQNAAGSSEITVNVTEEQEQSEELKEESAEKKTTEVVAQGDKTTEEAATTEKVKEQDTQTAVKPDAEESGSSSAGQSNQSAQNNQNNQGNSTQQTAANQQTTTGTNTQPVLLVHNETSQATTQTTTTEAGCNHNWVETTEHFAYEYPVTVERYYSQCNQCGTKFYIEDGVGACNYHTLEKDECWSFSGNLVETVIDHYEVDEWDEVVGYKCSNCGEERER